MIKEWHSGRLPRLGSISMGIMTKGNNGKPKPQAVDYFILPAEVQKVLEKTPGEKIKELDVVLPAEGVEEIIPAWYKRYSPKGLVCKGDGETATVDKEALMYALTKGSEYGLHLQGELIVNAKGQPVAIENINGRDYVRVSCMGSNCPYQKNKSCKAIAILSVLLTKVPGALGVFSLDTSSYNSYQNITSSIEMLRRMVGRVSMIPLKLRIEMQKKGEYKKLLPILYLDFGQELTFDQVQEKVKNNTLLSTSIPANLKLEPPDESKIPELLYPPEEEKPKDNPQGNNRKPFTGQDKKNVTKEKAAIDPPPAKPSQPKDKEGCFKVEVVRPLKDKDNKAYYMVGLSTDEQKMIKAFTYDKEISQTIGKKVMAEMISTTSNGKKFYSIQKWKEVA